MNNFITHFTGLVITYPYWNSSWSLLLKGTRIACLKGYHDAGSNTGSATPLFPLTQAHYEYTHHLNMQKYSRTNFDDTIRCC